MSVVPFPLGISVGKADVRRSSASQSVSEDAPSSQGQASVFRPAVEFVSQKVRRLSRSASHMTEGSGESAHRALLQKIGASFQNAGVAEVARKINVVSPDQKWIVDPDNPYRKAWLLVVFVLVLYTAVEVPFTVAFDQISTVLSYVDNGIAGLFFIDVLINFRSSYVDNGM